MMKQNVNRGEQVRIGFKRGILTQSDALKISSVKSLIEFDLNEDNHSSG